MRFRRPKSPEAGLNEINMTPLIDVSLVLVVMLLLATPPGFESSISVRRAGAAARAAEIPSVEERVELRVVSEDSVIVNRATVARANLADALRPALTEGGRIVVVTCAERVSHGTFVSVLDEARLSGATDLAITGR